MTKFKKEVNDKLVKQDSRLKVIAQYKDALKTQIDVHREEIAQKWEECTKEILKKLEVTENRMQEIEIRHLQVVDFTKKFTEF